LSKNHRLEDFNSSKQVDRKRRDAQTLLQAPFLQRKKGVLPPYQGNRAGNKKKNQGAERERSEKQVR